jgi:hypothetical protein
MKAVLKLLTILILSLFLASCSSDDNGDGPTDPNGGGGNGDGGNQPTIEVPEFSGPNTDAPEAQETKIYAQSFSSSAQVAGSYANYSQFLNQQDNNWTYSWTSEGLTYTITATNNADGSTAWNITVDGSNDDVSYDNYMLADGSKSADGSSGNWRMYDSEGNGMLQFVFEWSTDDNGVVTGTMEYPQDNIRIVMVNNPDGSGSIERYQDGTLRFEASWDGQGSGQYTKYDESSNVIDSGSWG